MQNASSSSNDTAGSRLTGEGGWKTDRTGERFKGENKEFCCIERRRQLNDELCEAGGVSVNVEPGCVLTVLQC